MQDTRTDPPTQIRDYALAKWLEVDRDMRTRFFTRLWPTARADEGPHAEQLSKRITLLLDLMEDYEVVMMREHDLQARLDRLAYLLHAYPREVVIELEGYFPAVVERYCVRMLGYVYLNGDVTTEPFRHLPFEPREEY